MINRESTSANGKNKSLIKKLQKSDDHSGTDFTGQQMFNLDLQGKDFSKCDFDGASLAGSNLAFCNFSGSNLTSCNLSAAHIIHCLFDGAQRSGSQILDFASMFVGNDHSHAFLCQRKEGLVVLVTEGGKAEYEFKRSGSSDVGGMLYNLLMNRHAQA